MPTLDDVYRKFGEAAEGAQTLETALGNGFELGTFQTESLAATLTSAE